MGTNAGWTIQVVDFFIPVLIGSLQFGGLFSHGHRGIVGSWLLHDVLVDKGPKLASPILATQKFSVDVVYRGCPQSSRRIYLVVRINNPLPCGVVLGASPPQVSLFNPDDWITVLAEARAD